MTIIATTSTLDADVGVPGLGTGLAIRAHDVGYVLPNGRRVLDSVSLAIQPGEIVAIAGGSGSGKSTLLDALAGVRAASEGIVLYDGVDSASHRDAFRSVVGYVPQDDIVHRDLPLRTTLRYSARLRLPSATPEAEIDAVVDAALHELGLEERADVRVGSLSGGQRKRASIGVELLTRPLVFFLDEPTSGLDPATARDLMRTLRALADRGTTIVLTTHNTDDLQQCDRVAFLGRGGHLAFAGTLQDALSHFGVEDATDVYELLTDGTEHRARAERLARRRARPRSRRAPRQTPVRPGSGPLRQWKVLTRRNIDVLRSNRLTLAVMFGSPALVIAMFVVLFDSGAFHATDPDPSAAVMIAFWTAFAGFFFGLTYGLLQVCTEFHVLRRERFVGLSIAPYLLAKMTVLVPVLALVVGAMVAALGLLNRLPDMDRATTAALLVTLLLDALGAVALGLLASSAVADPSQATLALPMLCFPAVLFSGAMLPVDTMAAPGRAISLVTHDRWAFEAIGRHVGLGDMARTEQAQASLAPFGDAFTGGVAVQWFAMLAFTVTFLAAAAWMLNRRLRSGHRVDRPPAAPSGAARRGS